MTLDLDIFSLWRSANLYVLSYTAKAHDLYFIVHECLFALSNSLSVSSYSLNKLEPVHIHIAEGRATANATKIWITSTGKALLCNNALHISKQVLKKLIRMV